MLSNTRWCPKCGTPVSADAKFCMACGTKMPQVAEKQEIVLEPKLKKSILARNAILLVVSIVLVVLSFLPMYSVSIHDDTFNLDVEINVSAITCLTWWSDAVMHNYVEDQLTDNPIADEMRELAKENASVLQNAQETGYFGEKANEVLGELVLLTTRLGLRSVQVSAPSGLWMGAITSLLLIVLAIVFFAMSFTGVVGYFIGKDIGFPTMLRALVFFVVSLVLFIVTMGEGEVIGSLSARLTVVPMLLFGFSGATILGLIAYKILTSKKKNVWKIVKNAGVMVLCVMALLCAFLPSFGFSVSANFLGKEGNATHDVYAGDIASSFSVQEEIDAFADFSALPPNEQNNFIHKKMEEFKYLSENFANDTYGKTLSTEVAYYLYTAENGSDALGALPVVFVGIILSGYMIGAVLCIAVHHLAIGEEFKISKIVFSALAVFFAALAFVLELVFVGGVTGAVDGFMIAGFSMTLSYGAVLRLVFPVVILGLYILLMLLSRRKKRKNMEKQTQKPQISGVNA